MTRDKTAEYDEIGAAVRETVAGVRAPTRLRASVAAQRLQHTPARRRYVRRTALAAGAALLAVAAVALVVGLSGPATSGPSIAEAAIAGLHPAGGAPPPSSGDGYLRGSVDGVAFPDYTAAGGWRAAGMRRDRVGGRSMTTVVYARGRTRVGYVIVDGKALPVPGDAQARTYGGVPVHVLERGGAVIVTWRRGGHTCILAARGLPLEPLLEFATRL